MRRVLLRKLLPVIIGLAAVAPTNAQTTWATDIAPIVYSKCTSCHHPGGIGPMSFMSYGNTAGYGSWMASEVSARNMPPWPPDTLYQRYVHDHKRILTQAEIAAFVSWAATGTLPGDTTQAPPKPVYTSALQLGTPDLQLKMPVYTSKATATTDDYVCISIPTGLLTSQNVRAIEIAPGNTSIVHHVLTYLDTTGTFATDTTGTCGGPTNALLLAGYEPGGTPTVFPDDGNNVRMGIKLTPGSNIVLALHYPAGSGGMMDSTTVNFHYYPSSVTNMREVSSGPILANWLFCVGANNIETKFAQYPPGALTLPIDFSVLSVFPHMHLLGKSIKAYGVKSNNDTIPMIRINDWDFDWQDYYFFKKVLKIPTGSQLFAEATYDNTVGNTHNPNSPPQLVCAGQNTTDEMFLVYMHYLPYLPGDEYINQDSLRSVGLSELKEKAVQKLTVSPNPFRTDYALHFNFPEPTDVVWTLHNIQGKVIREGTTTVSNGQQKVSAASVFGNVSHLPTGQYFQKVTYKGISVIGKIVKLE